MLINHDTERRLLRNPLALWTLDYRGRHQVKLESTLENISHYSIFFNLVLRLEPKASHLLSMHYHQHTLYH